MYNVIHTTRQGKKGVEILLKKMVVASPATQAV
jgi:hypothetical protein